MDEARIDRGSNRSVTRGLRTAAGRRIVTTRRSATHNQGGATGEQHTGNKQKQNLQQHLHESVPLSMPRINTLQHKRRTL
jgi:hypothetical protein